MDSSNPDNRILTPTWANLQFALVVIMLTAANLSIAVSQIALGLALIVQLYRRFLRREPLPAIGLGRWVLALAAWALVMIPFSTDPGQSMIFYKRFYLFAAIWVAASVAVDYRRQWVLMGAILTGAVAISLYGQIHVLLKTGSLFKLRLGEMSNPMTSGCLLMMSLLLAAGFLLSRGRSKQQLIWIGVAALPVALGLVQTMTRSALLGFAVGLGVMFLLARPRWFTIFMVVLILFLVSVSLLPDGVISREMSKRLDPTYVLQGNSTSQRLYMWTEGWAMVKQHPITGVGDRDLKSIGPRYYEHPDMNYYGHLHSNPVMLAAIWGIPGFLLGMGFLLRQLWLLIRLWRSGAGRQLGPPVGWVLGAVGVWAGFFTAGLTEWYFGDAESMLLYLAITGIALGCPSSTVPTGEVNV